MPRLTLAASILAGTVCAQQIPMPAYGSNFAASLTHGICFQAPTAFTITGIEVYNEQNQPSQVVEVIDFGNSPPPAWPAAATGTQLHFDNTTPSGSVAPMVVTVAAGQFIGVLFACTPASTSTISFNSHAGVPGPFTTQIFGHPITLTRIETPSGIAANGGNQACSQSPSTPIARAEIHVQTGGNFATKVSFGSGCNDRASESFYEIFDSNWGPFDLSHTSLAAGYTGTGYVVVPGSNAWFTPQSPMSLNDDQVIPRALGFSMPYPGGVATDLYISSNGFVYLEPDGNHGCCWGNANLLLTRGTPRWAALWNDLNPAGGGTVYFDVDSVNNVAYVTFDQVPRFGSLLPNTFQCVFHGSGDVELRYQTCPIQAGTTLVGFSPGSSADPGVIDVSATPLIHTVPDSVALTLSANLRPVIGTSIDLRLDNIPGGIPFAAITGGLTKFDPGLSLAGIGMPDCYQYSSVEALSVGTTPGPSFSIPLTIPNDPGLSGISIQIQGAAFGPGVILNALGAASSNGLELGIDLN